MAKTKDWKPRVCGRCPKWRRSWCCPFAKIMVAAHPACSLGVRLINSRDTAARAKASRREGE